MKTRAGKISQKPEKYQNWNKFNVNIHQQYYLHIIIIWHKPAVKPRSKSIATTDLYVFKMKRISLVQMQMYHLFLQTIIKYIGAYLFIIYIKD